MHDRAKKYTLQERKEIYARPLADQFAPVYVNGPAVVLKHLVKSETSEDYSRVLDVAVALAEVKRGPIYLLPEINAREKDLRRALGLSVENGTTPDIMIEVGSFVDVKSPESTDKIAANACKAFRQGSVVCITDHSTELDPTRLSQYAKWVLYSQGYPVNEAYFFIEGTLYKRTKE